MPRSTTPKKSRNPTTSPASGGGGGPRGPKMKDAKDTWVSMWSAVKPQQERTTTTTANKNNSNTKKFSPLGDVIAATTSNNGALVPDSPKKASSFLSARDLWSQRVTTTTTGTTATGTTDGETNHNNKSVRDQLSARSLATSFPLSPKKGAVSKSYSASFQAPLLVLSPQQRTPPTTSPPPSQQQQQRQKNDSTMSPVPKKERQKSASRRTSTTRDVSSSKSPTRNDRSVTAAAAAPTATTTAAAAAPHGSSTSPHRRASSLNSHNVVVVVVSPQRSASSLMGGKGGGGGNRNDNTHYSVRIPKPTAQLDRCLSLPARKAVAFRDRDDICEIERRVDLTADIYHNVWWNEEEYLEMRRGWETIVFLLETSQDVCEETLCPRGLHRRTTSGAWDQFEIQRDAQNAVFRCQDEQLKRSNSSNNNNNNSNKKKAVIVWDHEEIAHVYSLIAAPHREVAYQQGLADAQAAHEITKNLKPKRKKKKKNSSTNTTVEEKKTQVEEPGTTTKATKTEKKSKGLPPTASLHDSMKALGMDSSSRRRRNVAMPPPPLQQLPDEMFEPCDETDLVGKSRRAVSFHPVVSFIKNVKVKDMQKAIDRRWLGKHDLARIEADFKAVIARMEQPGDGVSTIEIDETTETIRGLEMSTEAGAMELQARRTTALRVVLDNHKTELSESLAKAYYDATRDSRKQAQKRGRSDQRAAKEARVRRRSIGQSTSFRSTDDKCGGDMQSVASVSTDSDSVSFAEPEFVRLARRRQQNRRSSHNDISTIINLAVIEEPTENNEEEMMDNDDHYSGKASIRGDVGSTLQTYIAATSPKSKTVVAKATSFAVAVQPSAGNECAVTIPSADQSSRHYAPNPTTSSSDFESVNTINKQCGCSNEVLPVVEGACDKEHESKAEQEDCIKATEQHKSSSKPRQRRRLSSSHAPSLRNLESSNDEKDKDQNPSLLWIRQRELLKSVGRRSPVPAPSTHWARNRSSLSLNELQNKQNAGDQSDAETLTSYKSCPNPPSAPLMPTKPSAPLLSSRAKTALLPRETKVDSSGSVGRRSPIPAPSTHWERNRSAEYLDQLQNKRKTSDDHIEADTIPKQQSCCPTLVSARLVPSISEVTRLAPDSEAGNAAMAAGAVGCSPKPALLAHWERVRGKLSLDDLKNSSDKLADADTVPTTRSCPVPTPVPLVPFDPESEVVSTHKSEPSLAAVTKPHGKPQTIQLPAQMPLLGVARIMSDMTECSSSIHSQRQASDSSSTNLAMMQTIASKPLDDRGDTDGLGRQGSGRFSVLSREERSSLRDSCEDEMSSKASKKEVSNEHCEKRKDEVLSKASWQQARNVFSGGESDPDTNRENDQPNRTVSSVRQNVSSIRSVDSRPSAGHNSASQLTFWLDSARTADNGNCDRLHDQSAESLTGRITILSLEEEGETDEDEQMYLEPHSTASNKGHDTGEQANEGGDRTDDSPNNTVSGNAIYSTEVHEPMATEMQIRKIASNDIGELSPTKEEPVGLKLMNESDISNASEVSAGGVETVAGIVSEVSVHKRERSVDVTAATLTQSNRFSILFRVDEETEIHEPMVTDEHSKEPTNEEPDRFELKNELNIMDDPDVCSRVEEIVSDVASECATQREQSVAVEVIAVTLGQSNYPSALSSNTSNAISDLENGATAPLASSVDPTESFCFGASGSQQGVFKSVKECAVAWDHSVSEKPASTSRLPLDRTESVTSTKQDQPSSEQCSKSRITDEPMVDSVAVPDKEKPREDPSVTSSALAAELTTDPAVRNDLQKDFDVDNGKSMAVSAEKTTEPSMVSVPAQNEDKGAAPPQFTDAATLHTNFHASVDVSERPASPKRNFFFNRLFSKVATEGKATGSCARTTTAPSLQSHTLETCLGTKPTSDNTLVGRSLLDHLNNDPLSIVTNASPSKNPEALDGHAQPAVNEVDNKTTAGIQTEIIAPQIASATPPSAASESRAAGPAVKEDEHILFKVKTSNVIRVPTADGRTMYLIIDPSMLDESSSQVQAS